MDVRVRSEVRLLLHDFNDDGFDDLSFGHHTDNESAYLNIPFGYSAEGCEVPDIYRKPIEDILKEY